MKSQESINQEILKSAISSGVINFLNQPAVIVSKELKIIEANQAFYEFFRIRASVNNIKHLYGQSTIVSNRNDAFNSIMLKHSSGEIGSVLMNTSNEDEFLILVDKSVVPEDLNKLPATEKNLKNQQDGLLDLLEHISDFTYLRVNTKNDSIRYSEKLLQLLDLEEGFKIGSFQDFLSFLHANDKAIAQQNYARCKNKIECEEFEVRLQTAEKRLRFLTIKLSIVEEEGMCLVILYDNSSQKMLEMALRDNEALFRSIFEQAAVGIAQVSTKGELLMFNQKLCDILGYKREQLMAVNYLKLTSPQDVNKDIEVMNQIFSNELDECIYEKRFLHKTGKPIWAKVHITVIRNEQKFPRYAVGIIDDISERKKAEEQILKQNEDLIRLNNEMDNFVYRTSHDLRAPLSSVLGLVNLLKTEPDEGEKQQYMEMIEKSIRRLDNSIHEILDLSRNSRLDSEFKKISLSELIKDIFDDLAHLKGFEKINVITNTGDGEFYSDDKRIKMIFNNLLSNAVIYHNPYINNSFIKISAEINDERALFRIEDNGLGIDQMHLKNIFKMFYRGNDTTPGSGLGLYIVKEAVEKLRGNISVVSEIGAGTCFQINIPNQKQKIIT